MPIGPSHGSRSGGSSFSGGSRSGGRSGGRSSSGSNLLGAILGGLIYSIFANRRHRHYNESGEPVEENGMPYRPRPTKHLVFAIIFAIFAAFTMVIRGALVNTMTEYNNALEIIKTDYELSYKPMIDAVAGSADPTDYGDVVDCGNGYYKTIAKFNVAGRVIKYTSYSDNPQSVGAYLDFEEDGISYYFLVYEYKDHNGSTWKGTTYTQFSANQYQNLNGEIEIAYHSKAGGERYSINTNYTTYQTAEYKYYEEEALSNKTAAFAMLIVFVVEVALVALFVVIYIKKLKKYKALVAEDEAMFQQKQQAEVSEAQAKAEEAQRMAKSVGRVCKYCGCDVPDGASACPGCGSRDFE